jgi:hypothetical protein
MISAYSTRRLGNITEPHPPPSLENYDCDLFEKCCVALIVGRFGLKYDMRVAVASYNVKHHSDVRRGQQ